LIVVKPPAKYPVEYLAKYLFKRLRDLGLVCGAVLLLTACGNGNFPNQSLIETAIVRQVISIQTPLSQQLKLPLPTAKDIQVSHITITNQDNITINNAPAYHLQGNYDLRLKQADHSATQTGDRFDVYLQSTMVGKIRQWKTAQPDGKPDGNRWTLESVVER
jgi:hypothetical protein